MNNLSKQPNLGKEGAVYGFTPSIPKKAVEWRICNLSLFSLRIHQNPFSSCTSNVVNLDVHSSLEAEIKKSNGRETCWIPHRAAAFAYA